MTSETNDYPTVSFEPRVLLCVSHNDRSDYGLFSWRWWLGLPPKGGLYVIRREFIYDRTKAHE